MDFCLILLLVKENWKLLVLLSISVMSGLEFIVVFVVFFICNLMVIFFLVFFLLVLMKEILLIICENLFVDILYRIFFDIM